jgi:cell division protein FtsA
VVSYAMLSEIIEPRATELIELFQAELVRSGLDKQLGAGVVLVGGGARLGGLTALAENMLGLSVRVGRPGGVAKMSEAMYDPSYATLVGLVSLGHRRATLREQRAGGWAGRFWSVLKGKEA